MWLASYHSSYNPHSPWWSWELAVQRAETSYHCDTIAICITLRGLVWVQFCWLNHCCYCLLFNSARSCTGWDIQTSDLKSSCKTALNNEKWEKLKIRHLLYAVNWYEFDCFLLFKASCLAADSQAFGFWSFPPALVYYLPPGGEVLIFNPVTLLQISMVILSCGSINILLMVPFSCLLPEIGLLRCM